MTLVRVEATRRVLMRVEALNSASLTRKFWPAALLFTPLG
jgi:hypothetical protein